MCPNYNYNRGVYKERKLVNQERKAGCIAYRSAGSHSPIDVTIIDVNGKEIKLVQCKPDSMSQNKKEEIKSKMPPNGYYYVYSEVI